MIKTKMFSDFQPNLDRKINAFFVKNESYQFRDVKYQNIAYKTPHGDRILYSAFVVYDDGKSKSMHDDGSSEVVELK